MFPAIPNPQVEPGSATYGEQDLVRRSASSVPAPARQLTPVAKLIDVSKCIGCKACQAACLEWNDLREPVGIQPRHLRQSARSDARQPHGDALHRVGEPRDQEPRVADPQGRLHALRRSGLPQGMPGARRHRAVLERHRRLRAGELHRLRLLREGMSVQHPAHLPGRPQGLQVHAVLGPRRGRPGPGLRQGLPDPGDRVRHQGRDEEAGRRPHQGPEVARLRQGRPLRSARRRRHARDVRAASRRPAADLCRPARQPEDQPAGRGLEGRQQVRRPGGDCASRPRPASSTTSCKGPTAFPQEDEENADRLAGEKS